MCNVCNVCNATLMLLSIFIGKCLFFQEKIYEIILKFAYIKKCLYLSFRKGTAVLEFLLKCQMNLTIPKILRTFACDNRIKFKITTMISGIINFKNKKKMKKN